MKNTVIGFLALTKGRKPNSKQEWENTTGYKKQARSIKDTAKNHGFKDIIFVIDHSTYSKVNWFTRNKFREAVREAIDHNQTLIVFDLISMLARCPRKDMLKWWRYLISLPIPIIDGLSARKLEAFSNREILSAVHNQQRDNGLTGMAIKYGFFISDHKGTQTSQNTRKLAEMHRKRNANVFAENISETIEKIKADLIKSKKKPSLQRIANEMNNRDIKARRGGKWSANSVKRVQDRLKTPE